METSLLFEFPYISPCFHAFLHAILHVPMHFSMRLSMHFSMHASFEENTFFSLFGVDGLVR